MNLSPQKPSSAATISWILYDFANTAFSMNVVSLYFGTWIIIHLSQPDFVVSLANSLSMVFVAVTLPVLGDWADRKGTKIFSLAVFTGFCIVGTAMLGFLGMVKGSITLIVAAAFVVFVIANYSYQGGLVFYNALMPSVSTPKNIGRISGYGVALGYVGSIAGLAIAGIFVDGELFGIKIKEITAGGAPAAFIPTAVLFLAFALPIFVFLKEPPLPWEKKQSWKINDSYKRVFKTLVSTKEHSGLVRFLIAKLFYEDSIQTIIIYMGVYAQKVVGFSLAETRQFFITLIPSAILGSAFCGIMTDHYGPKKVLQAVIG
jgi:UMF1 family MFS transporter